MHPAPKNATTPYLAVIPAGSIQFSVYAGMLYAVDGQQKPKKPISMQDRIKSADIDVNVTEFLRTEGTRRGTTKADALLKHIKAAFSDRGFKCASSFLDEAGEQHYYMTISYPVAMLRQELFDTAQEAVHEGIAAAKISRAEKTQPPATRASELFDNFSTLLTQHMGEEAAAELQKKHPKLLGALVQSADAIITQKQLPRR